MRFTLALLLLTFDPGFDFYLGLDVLARRDAYSVAGGVFDAGGGDGDGGNLVEEGVGPEGWRGGDGFGLGVCFFFFLFFGGGFVIRGVCYRSCSSSS